MSLVTDIVDRLTGLAVVKALATVTQRIPIHTHIGHGQREDADRQDGKRGWSVHG
jgi:hypothetical protein